MFWGWRDLDCRKLLKSSAYEDYDKLEHMIMYILAFIVRVC